MRNKRVSLVDRYIEFVYVFVDREAVVLARREGTAVLE